MTVVGPIPGLHVRGGGVAFPRDVNASAPELTNDDVHAMVLGPDWREQLQVRGRDNDHAERVWGVRRRQWCRGLDGTVWVQTTELAEMAARRALEDAGLDKVDLLIVATSTPDRMTATSAARVAKSLGLTCGAFDIHGAGAGAISALITAAQFLLGGLSTVLVVAADAVSPIVAPDDLNGRLLFAGGAAAVVVERRGNTRGLLGGLMNSAAVDGRPFTVPGPLPPKPDGDYVFQQPDAEYRYALYHGWKLLMESMRRKFIAPVDLFLPYPITLPQIAAAAEALDVPLEHTWHTLGEHGCVGCAGPLVSLVERRARFGLDGTVALAAVAGGLTGAALLWSFSEDK